MFDYKLSLYFQPCIRIFFHQLLCNNFNQLQYRLFLFLFPSLQFVNKQLDMNRITLTGNNSAKCVLFVFDACVITLLNAILNAWFFVLIDVSCSLPFLFSMWELSSESFLCHFRLINQLFNIFSYLIYSCYAFNRFFFPENFVSMDGNNKKIEEFKNLIAKGEPNILFQYNILVCNFSFFFFFVLK